MSEILRLYKKVFLIVLLSITLTFFKHIYQNTDYSYHKVQQTFYHVSHNPLYFVAVVESNITKFFNEDIIYDKVNFFQKPSFKVLFDNTEANVIKAEYFIPKSIDYIELGNQIKNILKDDLNDRKEQELIQIKENKRQITSFYILNDKNKSEVSEFFYFDSIGVTQINERIPIYRTFIIFFVIFFIIFLSYDFYKNKRY